MSNVNQDGETPAVIALDSIGNVYVSGNDGHYLTIKYNQVNGILPISGGIPKSYCLYQNYPNPFNPTTKINFALPNSSKVRIVVFNSIGQIIKELVNKSYEAGIYDIEFNGINLPSGVYFYQLIADERIDSKKFVLIK